MSTHNNLENEAAMENTVGEEEAVKPAPTWDTLPYDVKEMIIDKMDFITRSQLKLTSRANYSLIPSIPLRVEEFEIIKGEEGCEGLTVAMDEHFYIQSYIDYFHVQFGEEYSAHRRVHLPEDMEHLSSLWLLKKWLNQLLLTTKIRTEEFQVNIRPSNELIAANCRINVKSAIFNDCHPTGITEWLQLLAPGLEKLEISGREYYYQGLGMLEKVINCKDLKIECKNDITDQQLLTFKATQIELKNSKITPVGVCELGKKWINDDYPIGSKFKCDLKTVDMVLLEGIDYETMEANHLKIRIKMANGKQLIGEMKHGIEIYVEKE